MGKNDFYKRIDRSTDIQAEKVHYTNHNILPNQTHIEIDF